MTTNQYHMGGDSQPTEDHQISRKQSDQAALPVNLSSARGGKRPYHPSIHSLEPHNQQKRQQPKPRHTPQTPTALVSPILDQRRGNSSTSASPNLSNIPTIRSSSTPTVPCLPSPCPSEDSYTNTGGYIVRKPAPRGGQNEPVAAQTRAFGPQTTTAVSPYNPTSPVFATDTHFHNPQLPQNVPTTQTQHSPQLSAHHELLEYSQAPMYYQMHPDNPVPPSTPGQVHGHIESSARRPSRVHVFANQHLPSTSISTTVPPPSNLSPTQQVLSPTSFAPVLPSNPPRKQVSQHRRYSNDVATALATLNAFAIQHRTSDSTTVAHIGLLREAMSEQDLDFLFIHQLYCLLFAKPSICPESLANDKNIKHMCSFLVLAMGYYNHICPPYDVFFMNFPVPILELAAYSPTYGASLRMFSNMVHVSDQFNSLYKYWCVRLSPPLVPELWMLQITSSILQRCVFLCSLRGIRDQIEIICKQKGHTSILRKFEEECMTWFKQHQKEFCGLSPELVDQRRQNATLYSNLFQARKDKLFREIMDHGAGLTANSPQAPPLQEIPTQAALGNRHVSHFPPEGQEPQGSQHQRHQPQGSQHQQHPQEFQHQQHQPQEFQHQQHQPQDLQNQRHRPQGSQYRLVLSHPTQTRMGVQDARSSSSFVPPYNRPSTAPSSNSSVTYPQHPQQLPTQNTTKSGIPEAPFFPDNRTRSRPYPMTPNPDVSALHQAHLRSPILKAQHLGLDIYYQYVKSCVFDPPRRLTVAGKRIEKWSFTVTDEMFSLLPPTEEGQHGAPSTRSFNKTSQYFRLRCIKWASTDHPDEHTWATTETNWIPHSFFSLNDIPLEMRMKLDYGKDLSVDITPYLQSGENLIKIGIVANNEDWRNYLIGIEAVGTMTHEDIHTSCRSTHHQSAEEVLTAIKAKLSGTSYEDEIMVLKSSLTINLIDPFSASKMCDTPVRAKSCLHYDCFDLDTFLKTRPRKGHSTDTDRWRCPICRGDARPHQLMVDGFHQQVRKDLEARGLDKTRAIIVEQDGSWAPRIESEEDESKSDLVEGQEQQPARVVGEGEDAFAIPLGTEVIDLDD